MVADHQSLSFVKQAAGRSGLDEFVLQGYVDLRSIFFLGTTTKTQLSQTYQLHMTYQFDATYKEKHTDK